MGEAARTFNDPNSKEGVAGMDFNTAARVSGNTTGLLEEGALSERDRETAEVDFAFPT
jgi:hypothetical protein